MQGVSLKILLFQQKAQAIKIAYPNCPQYNQEDGSVKLAAGWLIDQCGLKGHEIGGAAVHKQQALVLINKNRATGQDIVNLAKYEPKGFRAFWYTFRARGQVYW